MSKKNIVTALGQVILIFIGVTTAIWFENVNEDRKTERFEQIVLRQMITNLESDIKWMDWELNSINRGIHAGNRMLVLINDQIPDKDSLGIYLIQAAWYSNTSYNTSSYETLKSKGLDIISNDTLRQRITEYYEVFLKNDQDQMKVSYNNLWNNYLPEMIDNFEGFSIQKGTTPINMEELKKNSRFRQLINITIGFKGLDKNQFTRMKRSANKLIAGIKEELK